MTTAIVTDAASATHTIAGHVERAERLDAVMRAFSASGLAAELINLPSRPATVAELIAVHTSHLLDAIQAFAKRGGGAFDSDTYVTAASWQAATVAAGSVVRAVEAVLGGECKNAFALVRPPGHHATASRAMGFCLINNIAVAARAALDRFGLQRVAIVDYDVHHGNGTQEIFYADPHVLFCSIHAAPFYPGTGAMSEMGASGGLGATLNVPLPFGVGDRGYARVFEQLIVPALRRFQPEMIFLSAGYDAHWSDPLGPMVLSVNGYAHLTQQICALADELCNGRLVCTLEGGYNLEALGACVVAALRVLLGRTPGNDPIGTITAPEPEIGGVIATLRGMHSLLRAS